jgi:hypothetical protein
VADEKRRNVVLFGKAKDFIGHFAHLADRPRLDESFDEKTVCTESRTNIRGASFSAWASIRSMFVSARKERRVTEQERDLAMFALRRCGFVLVSVLTFFPPTALAGQYTRIGAEAAGNATGEIPPFEVLLDCFSLERVRSTALPFLLGVILPIVLMSGLSFNAFS